MLTTQKLIRKDILQLVELFSESRDSMKLQMITKQWGGVKVTGNLNMFPNAGSIKVWRNMETNDVFWDDPEKVWEIKDNNAKCAFQKRKIKICLQTEMNVVEMSNCLFDVVLDWPNCSFWIASDDGAEKLRSFMKAILDFISENFDLKKEAIRERASCKQNPMSLAARFQSSKMVAKLIEIDKKLLKSADECACTALHFAVYYRCTSSCKILLENGANVDAITTGYHGETPLHIAVRSGYDEIVEVLLGYNANTKIKDTWKRVCECCGTSARRPQTALEMARNSYYQNDQKCANLIEAHEKNLDKNRKLSIKNLRHVLSPFYFFIAVFLVLSFLFNSN